MSYKSPATPEKGFTVVKDLRFVRVYRYISPRNKNVQYLVIEQKLHANDPVRRKFTLGSSGIYFEMGLSPDGEMVEIRAYYPLSKYSETMILNQAESDNHRLEREYKKLQKFKSIKL